VVEGAAIRPHMKSFKRHESGMSAALNIRNKLIVSRETIRKYLMFSGVVLGRPFAERVQ
jgi:hypothetical protein